MHMRWVIWNCPRLTDGFELARRTTESVQGVVIDKIDTLLTEDKAVARLEIYLCVSMKQPDQSKFIDLQNACPVAAVCSARLEPRHTSVQLKQWYFGLSDSTVRSPVVGTATVSVFENGASNLYCLQNASLNWPAVFSSLERIDARCTSRRSAGHEWATAIANSYHSQKLLRKEAGPNRGLP